MEILQLNSMLIFLLFSFTWQHLIHEVNLM